MGFFDFFAKPQPLDDNTSFKKSYNDLVGEAIENNSFEMENSPTFKLKRGEVHIVSIPATLGTYTYDGGGGYAVAQQRVKLWKGASVRLGGGKVVRTKSWVFAERGTLHITSNRVIFDGETKNYRVLMTKVLDTAFDDKIIYIDRETGADWKFKLDQPIKPKVMASAFLSLKGHEGFLDAIKNHLKESNNS